MRQTARVVVATVLTLVMAVSLLWAATANYLQTFDTGHGWTYTQVSCSGGTCSNNPTASGANCNGGTGGCVQATNSLTFNTTRTLVGYFKNSYTWQALGVPAGGTVTQVQGSWWNRSSSASACSSSTTAGMQIFDSANTTQVTSAAVATNVVVDGETAGASHTGSVVTVNAGFQPAATTVTLRFNLNPSAEGAFGTNTCNLFGDNYGLVITYTDPSGRRGQTIVGWNSTPDETLGRMRSVNVAYAGEAVSLAAVGERSAARADALISHTVLAPLPAPGVRR